jgi:hypothetical protein
MDFLYSSIPNNQVNSLCRRTHFLHKRGQMEALDIHRYRQNLTQTFRWFTPVVCDYNISIDKVGQSKHDKTLLRYKESKDRQHVSALFFYKAIISSDMVN